MEDSMGYTIKEVAEKLNISQYTLRYYDKEGLIPYLKREKNGIRRYTDEDIDWINMIISLRNIDMPITKIHEYITLYLQGDKTIEQRRELIQKYKIFIENKIKDTVVSLKITTKKLCEYDPKVADILLENDLTFKEDYK
jgi:DNA-binding transcriptional MerR regulator